MKWRGRDQSKNVEDRRGASPARRVGGGLGIGVIIIAIIAFLLGENPMAVIQQAQQQQGRASDYTVQPSEASGEDDELGAFVKVVLKETEDVWNRIFPEQLNRRYQEPILVLFSGSTQSPCGYAKAATGPFYCPGDNKLYIDLSFYNQLKTRFNAPGDFAMAYVVSHEVAHHVQNLLGITDKVHRMRGRISQADYNEQSVRLELQADFLAGVWAHYAQRTKGILDEGDIEEALAAAHAIGDDTIQKQSQGYVVPDAFTHGTSEQRMRWFLLGYKTGDLNQGDTFSARVL